MNELNQVGNEFGLASRWGLLRDNCPNFGARLVQERYRLHYLSDRAGLVGEWTEKQISKLEAALPKIIKAFEGALLSGELDAQKQKCFSVEINEFMCEADSLGSYGYIYVSIYPKENA